MKISKEILNKIFLAVGKILAGLIVIGLIFYYAINNSEYSTNTMEKDAKELVNKILKQNNLPYKCIRIMNLPDETIAMMKEYELVAELDNGEKVPIKFKRIMKNGKSIQHLEIIKK